jgi:microcystin-dependent protein
MKYAPPLGSSNPDANYINPNPAIGQQGSPVPAEAIEPTMREIVNTITLAGLEPRADNLSQLAQAIWRLSNKVPPSEENKLLLGTPNGEGYTSLTIEQLKELLGLNTVNSSKNVPVASVISSAAPTAPEGYLFCNGQAIARETYSELFSIIGTTYGVGNGSTTFNIPDYRGKFLACVGGNRPEIGEVQHDEIRNIVAALPNGHLAGWESACQSSASGGVRVVPFANIHYVDWSPFGGYSLTGLGGQLNVVDANEQKDSTGSPQQFNNPMAGHANGADIHPINMSVYYYIKF